jgi:two-component system chemotaxis sensor kinase CheA
MMDPKVFAQIWPVFQAEARDHLHVLATGILEFESQAGNGNRLAELRRAAHSLKGSAGSLGLEDFERISHAIEGSILGPNAVNGLPRPAVVAALDAIGALETALRGANESGSQLGSFAAVLGAEEILASLAAGGASAETPRSERSPGGETPAGIVGVIDRLEDLLARALAPDAAPAQRSAAVAEGAALALRAAEGRGDLAALASRLAETFPLVTTEGLDGARAAAAAAGQLVDLRQAAAAQKPAVAPSAPAQPAPDAPLARPGPRPERPQGSTDQSIRVLSGTVDSLSARIEQFLPALATSAWRGREMISMEASLREALAALRLLPDQIQAGDNEGAVKAAKEAAQILAGTAGAAGKLGRDAVRAAEAQRLAAHSIREDLRTLRMIPFGVALEALRRAALDAAVRLGKEVDLTISGQDVKLDRRIVDELRDPLLHLVRNAVDHGIEPPAVRRASAKPTLGTVSVRIESRGSRVGIVVEDDGAGLDLTRLKASAVRRGALTAEAAAKMTDDEAARLVFLPGLSTASEVTTFSGRGVGMDVVHDAVARLGGKVDLSFVPGRGTRFSLDLPLTLASTVGIMVRVGRDLAVVPQEAVEQVVSASPNDIGTIAGATTLSAGGAQIPFAPLCQLLGLPAGSSSARMPILVLAAGTGRAAVAVDGLVGQQEVVVSSLGSRASRVTHLAGAAVLDDGRVVAVLNVAELTRRVRPEAARTAAARTRTRLVVADDSLTTRTTVKALLEVAGYEVMPAVDGQEALEIVRQAGCDLVVSDVEMPRLDGLGLTRSIKSDPRLASTPVILVTSLGSAEDRAAGLSAGADGYLVKKEVQGGGKLLELVRQLLPSPA